MLHLRGSDYIIYHILRISTWYDRMDNFLVYLGFIESIKGSNLYFKVEGGRLVYVNDLKGDNELIVDAKRNISTEFDMKYLVMMHYFLGMEVW